jgi:hypothetical protein
MYQYFFLRKPHKSRDTFLFHPPYSHFSPSSNSREKIREKKKDTQPIFFGKSPEKKIKTGGLMGINHPILLENIGKKGKTTPPLYEKSRLLLRIFGRRSGWHFTSQVGELLLRSLFYFLLYNTIDPLIFLETCVEEMGRNNAQDGDSSSQPPSSFF